MSRKLALIIGNSEYQDPTLARLVTPNEDVNDLAEVLRAPEIGEFDEVTTLVNEPSANIRLEVESFFAEKKPDDLLVLYFSGHGVRDDQGQLYLAVKDTRHNRLRATAIPAAFITDGMDHSRSRRQVLILDCCHSGAFAQGIKGATGASVGTASAFEGTGYGRVVLTATDSTQYAWEGDEVIGEAENSVFTHYLIEGLRTGAADMDADGRISLDELYDYVYEQVVNKTPKQTPGKSSYKQQGEIVIARNPRPIKPKPAELPVELRHLIENPVASAREAAVRELSNLLYGSIPGLVLAAHEALKRLAEDDSKRVANAAAQILAAYAEEQRTKEGAEAEERAREEAARKEAAERARREAEERARREAQARAETEQLAAQRAEEERLAREKAEAERKARERAEAERKAKEEAERLAAQEAEEEQITREKVRQEAMARERAERLAAQQAEAERRAREQAEKERQAHPKEETEQRRKAGLPVWALGLGGLVLMACLAAAAVGIWGAISGGATQRAPTQAGPWPTTAPGVSQSAATTAPTQSPVSGEPAKATPGQAVSMVLLPKFLGILVFDQAHTGAEEAAKELQNPEALQFLGPTPENSVAGQIEIVTTATTQGVDAIMISNNAGDQIAPAAQAAVAAGIKVVTWDSPIPSAEGEQLFIAEVDFGETGTVMADMALHILGDDGGKFAVLSASPDAANQNAWIAAMEEALKDPKYAKLELLDIVYGNDQSEESYNQALALVDKYPDLGLIMAPTTVGIAAAAKAMQDEGLCDTVKVSGLGLPSEMVSYTLNGCAPEFALWSFVDLGYLTYYTTYLLATGAIEGKEGETFEAGRMGTYTITKDPYRDAGLRVLMGPFKVYDKDNVEAEAK